ncbi:MAG: hypothetical protein JSR75_20825 [Proteobacteria bacterium]|nr:hypothetical protein [Pseudomonadota bacterium]
MNTLVPLAGSAVLDQGQQAPGAATAYPVQYELSPSLAIVARAVKGSAVDLGAVEY